MALLLPQGQVSTVVLGPFVHELDGDTILAALTIAAADVGISHNAAVFTAKHEPSAATYDQGGYYRVTLDATDTATTGQGRLVVKMPGALAVWTDFFVVSLAAYTSLAGLSVVPILLRGTAASLILGPCVSASDGVTLISNLTLSASDIHLSKADGTFGLLHSATAIMPLGFGMYRIPLDVADTNTPGALQVSLDPGTCLPVWMDATVVSDTVWQLFFPLPVTPPPAPAPLPTTPPRPPTRITPRLRPPAGGLGRRHLDVQKQVAMIEGHGTAVYVMPKLQCPCLLEEGQPDPLCPICQGTGRMYVQANAFATTMLLTHESAEHSLQEVGFWTSGMVRASILPGIELGYEDYVRQVDLRATFNNEVLTKDLDDTLLFRYGIQIDTIADRETLYQAGLDYVLTSPNGITWVAGGRAPAMHAQYAVRYRAYPEYLVAAETPRLRIEGRRAQSRVVTLKLLEKTSKVPQEFLAPRTTG